MTDFRLPERWLMDRRIMPLSAPEFRSFVLGYLWSVSNRTDGFIDRDDISLVPGMTGQNVAAFVSAELWEPEGTGFRMIDFEATQTNKHDLEVLDNARRADREKKARARAAKRSTVVFPDGPGDAPPDSPGDAPPDSPGDAPGDESRGQHRRGEARRGEAGITGTQDVANTTTGEVLAAKTSQAKREPATAPQKYETIREGGKTRLVPVGRA